MSFEISKITNKDLRDIATIIDENNDGVISDGNETSIFLQKGQDLVNIGLVLEKDYEDIKKFCPQNKVLRGGVILHQKAEEAVSDDKAQQEYISELNSLVTTELKRKKLQTTDTNKLIALETIKKRKDLEIEIKIHNKRIEQLKKEDPKKFFEKRLNAIEATVTTGTTISGVLGGGLAALKIGTLLGSGAGPVGIIAGAFIGGIIGVGIGIFASDKISSFTVSEKDIENAKKEIDKLIINEEKNIEDLKRQLEAL